MFCTNTELIRIVAILQGGTIRSCCEIFQFYNDSYNGIHFFEEQQKRVFPRNFVFLLTFGSSSPQTTTNKPLTSQALLIRENEKADSTLRSSRAVPHPSTNRALRRLTSEVGRDPVHSTRYGRQRILKRFCVDSMQMQKPVWDQQHGFILKVHEPGA